MDKKLLNLLYRSFDCKLSENEQYLLEQALKNSKELKFHKEEMEKMRGSLKRIYPQGFGYMFADKVMQKINTLEEKSSEELFFNSIFSIFKPIAVAAAFLLVFLLSYNLIVDNGDLFKNYQESNEMTLVEAFDPYNDLTME